jgi:hypothetical protein
MQRILRPFRKAAAAFFSHHIALRRDEGQVLIVLQERADPERKNKAQLRAEQLAREEREEFELMMSQLRGLLDEIADTRTAMRHLAFVEQSLGRKGLRALHKLPLDVLRRALEQFEGLVTNWSPAGLANLRSKMAVAIIDREHSDPEAENDAYRTAAVLDASPMTSLPEVEVRSDDEALAAAYAALGNLAPVGVEIQGELGSASTKALAPPIPRASETGPEIQIRVLTP